MKPKHSFALGNMRRACFGCSARSGRPTNLLDESDGPAGGQGTQGYSPGG